MKTNPSLNDMTVAAPVPAFILAKRHGAKWFAIAGTNSGGCLAASQTVFSFHGFDANGINSQIHWGEVLLKQKNFAGFAADYREVELAEDARKLHWFKETLRLSCYPSLSRFLTSFPDAAPFAAELSAIKS